MISKNDLLAAELGIDLTEFFDPDAPSGEPVLSQVKDPFTGTVHAPGLEVAEDGTVTFRD